MTPTPYYETPADAPCKVRLYHGDCRVLLPVVARPAKAVLMLADPLYGLATKTTGRGRRSHNVFDGSGRPRGIARDRTFTAIGDAEAADVRSLFEYPRLLLWGWNHLADQLPPSPSAIIWDKRDGVTPDDGADCEIAWSNLGGPARVFRHLWRGLCRASETGAPHLHPTQKPEAFYRWLFAGRGRGNPIARTGDLVVSPYLGSGPEITVAIEWGIDAIGIELERTYLDVVIEHRIRPALARARQTALPFGGVCQPQ